MTIDYGLLATAKLALIMRGITRRFVQFLPGRGVQTEKLAFRAGLV